MAEIIVHDTPPGFKDIVPTIQEQLLVMLGHHAFSAALPYIVADLEKGKSPSALSIARPDILIGFAETWRASGFQAERTDKETYKQGYFDKLTEIAAAGDPAAVEALPKFATSVGQLAIASDLILSNQKQLESWHSERAYIQYLGTFDPQHIGHRIAVQSALATEGESASAILHTMGQHPRKKSFSASYEERSRQAEQRFYESPLLDNKLITHVDIPGGVGLAESYPEQMALLASFSGDTEYRWLTGSDKLLLDVNAIKLGHAAEKAARRFSDPNMHAYFLYRKSDERREFENGIDYVIDQFGTHVTIVEEAPYDCAPASSSLVKQLRDAGKYDEADHMEFYELPR